MSGCSYDSSCPNCGGTTMCYSDHKPFDYVSGDCADCGFYFYTKAGYRTLEGLNEYREELHEQLGPWDPNDETEGYLPLKELPEQDEDYGPKDTPCKQDT